MKKQTDILIVGQGLAGTWLHYFCTKVGLDAVIINQHHEQVASHISSGIINPITGRHLVKTWLCDTLLPFAKVSYKELEQLLGGSFVTRPLFTWQLQSSAKINQFEGRSATEGYSHFIDRIHDTPFGKGLQPAKMWAEVKGGLQINVADLLFAYRNHLTASEQYIEQAFQYQDLRMLEDGVEWKGIQAKKIIFCEGAQALDNPYFQQLPFRPGKGDRFIIHAPELDTETKIIKGNCFLVPLGEDRYWVGSTLEQGQGTLAGPDPAHAEILKERLATIINVPYTIVHHGAGIRPASKYRRPMIGLHTEHQQIGIFNGLGTKGASLAPYFAAQFMAHMQFGTPLHPAVNIANMTP